MKTRIIAILRKEIAEIWRDPYTLGFSLALPLILLVLFAYGLNLDVTDIRLLVYDQDQSAESRAYVQAFINSGYFSNVGMARDEAEVNRALDAGDAQAALVIPPTFGRDLSAGRRANAQTILDGSFTPTAQVAQTYITAITAAFSSERVSTFLAARTGRVGLAAIEVEPRVWFNPTLASINSIVPGLFAVILMAFPPLLSALAIVREKERGSIQQIFASPTQPYEFIIGKMIPYGALAFVEMLIILAAGVFWFRVPFQGSVVLLLAAGLIYVFTSVGIGLLVSTVTRTQVAAMLMALVLTMMPSMIYSGFIYPIHTMPLTQQLLSTMFPAQYFTEIARGIVLKGSDFGILKNNLVILSAYTAAIIGLAAWRFHKKVG
jgi:ABC-2 type transport system permease protein